MVGRSSTSVNLIGMLVPQLFPVPTLCYLFLYFFLRVRGMGVQEGPQVSWPSHRNVLAAAFFFPSHPMLLPREPCTQLQCTELHLPCRCQSKEGINVLLSCVMHPQCRGLSSSGICLRSQDPPHSWGEAKDPRCSSLTGECPQK